jgi:hypothetical protein
VGSERVSSRGFELAVLVSDVVKDALDGLTGVAHFQTFSPDVLIKGSRPFVTSISSRTITSRQRSSWISAQSMPPAPVQAVTKRVSTTGKARISMCIREPDGQGPHGTPYELRLSDGQLVEGKVLLSGRLIFTGLPGGTCKLRLPEVDHLKWDRRPPAEGRAYPPGKSLSLQTGKHHDIWVPEQHTYWVQLAIAKRTDAAKDDRFTLKSHDGSYEVTRSVANDLTRAAEGLTLEFPRLRRGLKYSLVHDRGAEARPE